MKPNKIPVDKILPINYSQVPKVPFLNNTSKDLANILGYPYQKELHHILPIVANELNIQPNDEIQKLNIFTESNVLHLKIQINGKPVFVICNLNPTEGSRTRYKNPTDYSLMIVAKGKGYTFLCRPYQIIPLLNSGNLHLIKDKEKRKKIQKELKKNNPSGQKPESTIKQVYTNFNIAKKKNPTYLSIKKKSLPEKMWANLKKITRKLFNLFNI